MYYHVLLLLVVVVLVVVVVVVVVGVGGENFGGELPLVEAPELGEEGVLKVIVA